MDRSLILNYFTILLLGFLGLRLLQLQIIEHDKYSVLAKNNTTRTSVTRAPRGIIYDRNQEILATSKQSLSVIVYPASLRKAQKKEKVAKLLANFIEPSYEDLKDFFDKMDPTTPLPISLDNEIDIQTAIKIFENQKYLPGISVEKQATRYYPFHKSAAHFLGYVGQIDNKELKRNKSRGLGLGDIIGKEGLEKVFDETLQGQKGEARVSVDRYGKSLNRQKQKKVIKNPIKGQDLKLTIDIEVQKAAYQALKHLSGAAVAMNPKNGEIYALVSTPSFDPNIFTKPISSKDFNELMSKKAFLNRAISAYTPGSIWKPFTALAALEHNAVRLNEYLPVSGSYNFNGFNFGDWTSKKDIMNLSQALEWSRNTFFYQIARRMQVDWLTDIGKAFGAGQRTDLELLGESKGVLPSPAWKKKNLKQAWFPGNTLHFSIGQSFLLLSPIQVAKMYAGIANAGKIPEPHIIKDNSKEDLSEIKNISQSNYEVIRNALIDCVNTGTGQASKLKKVQVAGKTGSAEVSGYAKSTHGWFASFAPAHDPEIVVVVFAEGAGHGGSVAAPVAKKIYQAYFAQTLHK